MKVCLFGGTFDPPHLGHENIVARLIKKFDKVIVIPTKETPGKNNLPLANNCHRLQMLLLCDFVKNPNCIISDYEVMSSNSPSYTINTLNYIKDKFKDSEFYIAIGEDQLNDFSNWHDSDKILSSAKIICFNRKKGADNKELINCEFINNFDYNISSSEIRNSILNNDKKFKTMVNRDIFNYIIKEKLYTL